MRQWLQSKLTYANVMVTILAFIVLGGGTAVALNGTNTVFSDDITDNQVKSADVRDDTLAGGGLGAADLKASSVGTSEVAVNSLNGGDINESGLGIVPNSDKLDGKDSTEFLGATATAADSYELGGTDASGFLRSGNVQKLMYEDTTGAASTPTDIATIGVYTIKADCVDSASGGGSTRLQLLVSGPSVGTSDYADTLAGNDFPLTQRFGTISIPANTDAQITEELAVRFVGQTGRMAGTAMFQTPGPGGVLPAVIQVDYNGFVNREVNPEACYLYGTATKGT